MLELDKLILKIEGKIPITFGSIGHRDVLYEDLDIAATKVVNVLRNYRQRFPDTPFLFLCPLAEGSDITVTEAVASINDPSLFILPTLPFEIKHYRETISRAWQNRFDILIAHPKSLPAFIISKDISSDEEAIKRYYQKAGEFVACYSHILFAIKDNWGTLKRFVGGTADIIHYRRNGCTNPGTLSINNIRCAEEGHLYEIRVRRKDHPSEKLEPEYCYNTPRYERHNYESKNNAKSIVISPHKLGKSWLNDLFETIFDQQSHLHDPDLIAFETNLLNQAISNSRKSGVSDKQVDSITTVYINELDKIATSLKNTYIKYHLYPAFIIALLIALLETFDFVMGEKGGSLLFNQITVDDVTKTLKFILISGLLLIGFSELINRFKHRFESTRAICESLKVQGYWINLGIEESAADYLLAAQIGDSSWVRRTLRSASTLDFDLARTNKRLSSEKLIHKLKSTKEMWITGQITFFTARIKEFEYKLKILKIISYSSLSFGVISYLLSHEFIAKYLHLPLIFGGFYLLFFVLFTLAKGFAEIQAYEVLVKRYKASKHIFQQVDNIYQNLLEREEPLNPSTLQRLRNLFQMLGISVLEETSEWYVMNSRLKFKSPQGG